jgi:hypothetical protein
LRFSASSPPIFFFRASRLQAASSRDISQMQASQCGSQMGAKLREEVYDEHGIGGGGVKYCGNNDAQLGRINVIYHGASGRRYVLRSVLFDLGPGVIGAVRASPLGELFRQGPLHKSRARVLLNPTVV